MKFIQILVRQDGCGYVACLSTFSFYVRAMGKFVVGAYADSNCHDQTAYLRSLTMALLSTYRIVSYR